MDNVFVLFLNNHLVGVYTTHRKAVQAILMHALKVGWNMTNYSYQFGSEFFTYVDEDNDELLYELMEVTPDEA